MTVGSVEAVIEAAIFAALTYIGFTAAGYFLHALGTVCFSAAAFDSTDSGSTHTMGGACPPHTSPSSHSPLPAASSHDLRVYHGERRSGLQGFAFSLDLSHCRLTVCLATVLGPCAILLVKSLGLFVRSTTVALVVFEVLLLSVACEALHRSFHSSKPPRWLSKVGWWRRARKRHFHHHRHLSKNLAVGAADSTWDRLMGTIMQ